MDQGSVVVHTDGGARGNPGPGACSFVIEVGNKFIFKGSKFLNKVTNNVAEYSGVLEALRWINENKSLVSESSGPIEFYMDSELVVKQIRGEYKVKDENLRSLFLEVKDLMEKVGKNFLFKNIPRNKNKIADLLVNEELDRNK